MDIFFGSKKVHGIYKGDRAVHGIMVDSKLYPGEMGMTWATRPSSGENDWWPVIEGSKSYYNHSVSSGYGITLYGTHAYNTTVLSGGVLRAGEFSSKVDENYTLATVVGSAVNTTVEYGGKFFVGGGDGIVGFADQIVISSGGSMVVSSGGTAYNVTSQTGASITVDAGGIVTYT